MNPSTPPSALLLFDLAGTTVTDADVVRTAFLDVAADVGLLDPSDAAAVGAAHAFVAAHMGRDKTEVFAAWREAAGDRARAGVPDAPALAAAFAARIAAIVDAGGMPPIDGVPALMRELAAAGCAVGCTSGFDGATARRVVAAAGLPVTAPELVIGSDEVPAGRPAPDLIRAAMQRSGVSDPARVGAVGDTPADLDAGIAAACGLVIGVGTGAAGTAGLIDHLRSRRATIDASRTTVHVAARLNGLQCTVADDGRLVAGWPAAEPSRVWRAADVADVVDATDSIGAAGGAAGAGA